jgi:hypothetical protein
VTASENELQALANGAAATCAERGWSREWKEAGVILHLECSEFIESLRGKRGQAIDEAADILFVVLSTMVAHGLSVESVMARLRMLAHGGAIESSGRPLAVPA